MHHERCMLEKNLLMNPFLHSTAPTGTKAAGKGLASTTMSGSTSPSCSIARNRPVAPHARLHLVGDENRPRAGGKSRRPRAGSPAQGCSLPCPGPARPRKAATSRLPSSRSSVSRSLKGIWRQSGKNGRNPRGNFHRHSRKGRRWVKPMKSLLAIQGGPGGAGPCAAMRPSV